MNNYEYTCQHCGAAVSSGNPIDTINALQELNDWRYYNGGVIDTGW